MSGSKDYTIQAYIGYTDDHITVVRGRVLDDPAVVATQSDSKWTNLKNSFRRFISNEVPYQEVLLTVGATEYTTKTDSEGYFIFELDYSLIQYGGEALSLYLNIPCQPKVAAQVIKIESDYIVISDIDDTIIKTQVSSVLKLKLLFNTIFRNQYQRTAISGMAEVYQQIKQDYKANFFYISKSPHNLYTYIVDFLQHNNYPLGSIILRDFGWHLLNRKKSFSEKYGELDKLYKRFPDKQFILVGDAAEKDADIYLDVVQKFPNRIAAIYLRSVKHKKKMLRVRGLIENYKTTEVLMVESSAQAISHARSKGFIK